MENGRIRRNFRESNYERNKINLMAKLPSIDITDFLFHCETFPATHSGLVQDTTHIPVC
jgi:hypothetical protein